MPIYQVIRLRVLQSLVYVHARDQDEAASRAKDCPYDKEVLSEEAAEVVWRWEEDDADAPDPTPRE